MTFIPKSLIEKISIKFSFFVFFGSLSVICAGVAINSRGYSLVWNDKPHRRSHIYFDSQKTNKYTTGTNDDSLCSFLSDFQFDNGDDAVMAVDADGCSLLDLYLHDGVVILIYNSYLDDKTLLTRRS